MVTIDGDDKNEDNDYYDDGSCGGGDDYDDYD